LNGGEREGEAWAHFFEDSQSFNSRKEIFTFCQYRPRDVLTYVSFALELAVSRSHRKINPDDISSACERFSTSKLKDLADEFAENYPNIQLVLRLTEKDLRVFLRQAIKGKIKEDHINELFDRTTREVS
jgi:hypothetical protein